VLLPIEIPCCLTSLREMTPCLSFVHFAAKSLSVSEIC
jgi:hypothetical protein